MAEAETEANKKKKPGTSPMHDYISRCLEMYVNTHPEEGEKLTADGKTVDKCEAAIIAEARQHLKPGSGCAYMSDTEVAQVIRDYYGLDDRAAMPIPQNGPAAQAAAVAPAEQEEAEPTVSRSTKQKLDALAGLSLDSLL